MGLRLLGRKVEEGVGLLKIEAGQPLPELPGCLEAGAWLVQQTELGEAPPVDSLFFALVGGRVWRKGLNWEEQGAWKPGLWAEGHHWGRGEGCQMFWRSLAPV